jgi:hypothetical protein
MPKFRKKPVVVEAIQYIGPADEGGFIFVGRVDWLDEAFNRTLSLKSGASGTLLHIDTLEGSLTVSPNDWIIRGVKGELYPCKPDIFAATYELVKDQADA